MGCGHAKYTPFDSFHVPSHVLEMVEGMCSYLRPLNQNERISLGVDTHSSITTYLERNDLHCLDVAEIFQRFLNYSLNKQFSIIKAEVIGDGSFFFVLIDIRKPIVIYVISSHRNESGEREVFLQCTEPTTQTLASYRVALSNIFALKND